MTDLPEALLLAFCEVYTADTAEHLLTQVRHARTLPDLPTIRQHLTDAVARGYVEGR